MHRQSGFSLVELSIVLVILGLLTGGILTGQSLIRASELRSITTDFQRYQAAVNTFRDKYFALPGDMRNATSFWGVQHATPATCQTTASSSALTCDGDGDGTLELNYEIYRGVQHLANAGLIEGSYSGIPNPTTTTGANSGVNTPKAKLGAGVGFVIWTATGSGDANRYTNTDGLSIYFGKDGGSASGALTETGAIKPEEAWNIDSKLDDGKPSYGKVATFKATGSLAPNCSTTNVESTAEYALTSTTNACMLAYRF